MASKTSNVGIIGYGLSAKVFHIPLFETIPEFNLYAIVQRHPRPGDDASEDHPETKKYNTAEEVVQDASVDVVVVTTTPATHFELAKLALEHRKHVIVEKPFVATSEEADHLIALAKKYQRLLTVYHNRRWDSDFLTVRELLVTNTLGRIVDFESHFDRYKPSLATGSTKAWKTRPEPGGGAIYDLGSHLIDQIILLFGLPKAITAFLGSQRTHDNKPDGNYYEDACTLLMHYAEGMTATAKVSVISPEPAQLRFWVRGQRGSYKKFHEDVQEVQLKAGMKPDQQTPGFGIEAEERAGTLTLANGEDGNLSSRPYPSVDTMNYRDFYTQFARALTNHQHREPGSSFDNSEVPVKPEDARAVIRLIELAKQSSDERRTVDV